jgi:hypothetical protein
VRGICGRTSTGDHERALTAPRTAAGESRPNGPGPDPATLEAVWRDRKPSDRRAQARRLVGPCAARPSRYVGDDQMAAASRRRWSPLHLGEAGEVPVEVGLTSWDRGKLELVVGHAQKGPACSGEPDGGEKETGGGGLVGPERVREGAEDEGYGPGLSLLRLSRS